MIAAMQREGMSVGDAGSQAVGDLRRDAPQSKQGRLDAISVHDPDVFIKPVYVVFIQLDPTVPDALRIGKCLHVHGEYCVLFFSHALIFR